MRLLYALAVTLALLTEALPVIFLASDGNTRAALGIGAFFAFCDVALVIGFLKMRSMSREMECKPCKRCGFPTMARDEVTREPLCWVCCQKTTPRRAI